MNKIMEILGGLAALILILISVSWPFVIFAAAVVILINAF